MRPADFHETSRRHLLEQEARRDRFLRRVEACIPYAGAVALWWVLWRLTWGAQ